jgi:hypothetical protein
MRSAVGGEAWVRASAAGSWLKVDWVFDRDDPFRDDPFRRLDFSTATPRDFDTTTLIIFLDLTPQNSPSSTIQKKN